MDKLKYIITLFTSVSLLIFISSCSQEDPLTPEKDRYITFDRNGSVIPSRIQFSKDMIYFFRLAFDSNYLQEDSIIVLAYFNSDTDTVSIDIYDDGVIDDSLRNDLAASNNVWSGGINAQSFPAENYWKLNINVLSDNNAVFISDAVEGIRVSQNSAPVIVSVTGISSPDTLESGFSARTVSVRVDDADNDASGYNDNQILKLEIRNRDNIPKDYIFQRTDPLAPVDFVIDSTLAAGLKTNDRYDLRFIATDFYGESDSLKLSNVRIENTAPVITKTEHPDTVITADNGVLWVRSGINDRQGHLAHQDIDKVEININSYVYQLLDDGEFISSGDETENDGVYSIGFSYDAGDSGTFDITVTAFDKAGNASSPYQSSISLVPGRKNNINGNINESSYNYSNPFSAD